VSARPPLSVMYSATAAAVAACGACYAFTLPFTGYDDDRTQLCG